MVVAGGSDAHDGNYDFALARYTRKGALDPPFGRGGLVFTDFSGHGSADGARALALQPDGKIVVVGGTSAGDDLGNFAIARYQGAVSP